MLMNKKKGAAFAAPFSCVAYRVLTVLCHLRRHSHPHQSKIGSEEPIFDSFSLKGEAIGANFRKV